MYICVFRGMLGKYGINNHSSKTFSRVIHPFSYQFISLIVLMFADQTDV